MTESRLDWAYKPLIVSLWRSHSSWAILGGLEAMLPAVHWMHEPLSVQRRFQAIALNRQVSVGEEAAPVFGMQEGQCSG